MIPPVLPPQAKLRDRTQALKRLKKAELQCLGINFDVIGFCGRDVPCMSHNQDLNE